MALMAQEARSARVLAQALDLRSALGQHTAALIQVLAAEGWSVTLDVQDRRAVPGELRSLLASSDVTAVLDSPAILTVLEYPIWFPLAERFRETNGTAVFWYHGVTPPALWGVAGDSDIFRRSEVGANLAWHAHLAIADSPFIAQELMHHSGFPHERIRVVPIGVDVARFRCPPIQADLLALRKRWRINGRRVLLYVGRISRNKRLDLLVDALAMLNIRCSDLHLVIVGDASSVPAYRDLSAQLRDQAVRQGIGDRVTFTGQVESVLPFYHLADVCVLPSQHEGFGVPLVEAMAAGVPVVAAASGAMPWVLDAENDDDRAAGLLVAPGDAADLAAKIALVLEDATLRRAMIERSRQRAEFFSMEQFEIRTRAALSEAGSLAREGPPPAAERISSQLYTRADVALRGYRVRSRVPLLGPLIEWLRTNSTTHVKEAYLDRIIEQQVLFNQELVIEIERLRSEVNSLRDQISQLVNRESL
jgi:glycosyltransferase involved in cell wall biosynthesis